MTLREVAKLRLLNQQIAATKFKRAKSLVAWMGALQAQDFAMAKWAIGARLSNATDQTIEEAISKGEVLRTHLLRPTWHLVAADDIHWLLALTAPQIRASAKSRDRQLELSDAIFSKSNKIIETALRDGTHLTRKELVAKLRAARIPTDENRASHLLLRAELEGIVCSGAINTGKQTYALLAERVPRSTRLNREEALAKLAHRYFTSHGPATVQDFTWWSGLPAGDAKRALEMIKPDFTSETINAQSYWFAHSTSVPKAGKESVHLLPAFDEFTISYKDRSASLPAMNHRQTISNNGIFRPVIVVNGQVTGIWKRAMNGDMLVVNTEFFDPPGKSTLSLLEKAAMRFGGFVGKRTKLNR